MIWSSITMRWTSIKRSNPLWSHSQSKWHNYMRSIHYCLITTLKSWSCPTNWRVDSSRQEPIFRITSQERISLSVQNHLWILGIKENLTSISSLRPLTLMNSSITIKHSRKILLFLHYSLLTLNNLLWLLNLFSICWMLLFGTKLICFVLPLLYEKSILFSFIPPIWIWISSSFFYKSH